MDDMIGLSEVNPSLLWGFGCARSFRLVMAIARAVSVRFSFSRRTTPPPELSESLPSFVILSIGPRWREPVTGILFRAMHPKAG
jgi:hypothetical protein